MPRGRLVLALALLLLAPTPALAYLDSGSTSALFQAAAAGLFTLLFLLKTYWARLKSFVSRTKPDGGGSPPRAPEGPPESQAP